MCVKAFCRALALVSTHLGAEGGLQPEFIHEALCEFNDKKRALCCRVSPGARHVYKDILELQYGPAYDYVLRRQTSPAKPHILVAGFSCKDLSMLHNGPGQMKRFGGGSRRNSSISTFEATARCAERWQPDLIIMENVKALLAARQADGGARPIVLVSERLRQIGFLGLHNLLQAESFGLPQRRGRVWLIYFRAGCGAPRRQ